MSKKNGTIINKEKLKGKIRTKYKISLIDLAIKKAIFSKNLFLKFCKGKA